MSRKKYLRRRPVFEIRRHSKTNFMIPVPMYTNPDHPGKIFCADKESNCFKEENEEYNPGWISGIVSHETLHDVLNRMGLMLASYGLDCLWRDHSDADTDVGLPKSTLLKLERKRSRGSVFGAPEPANP